MNACPVSLDCLDQIETEFPALFQFPENMGTFRADSGICAVLACPQMQWNLAGWALVH